MGIMGEICRRGRQERNGKGTTGEREEKGSEGGKVRDPSGKILATGL